MGSAEFSGDSDSTSAPATSKFVLQQADAALPNAQDLSLIATGAVLKVAVSGGVATVQAAVAGTDFAYPGRVGKLIASAVSKTGLAKDSIVVDAGTFLSLEKWNVTSGTWSTPATVARGGAVAYTGTTTASLDRRSAQPGTNQPFVLGNQPFYAALALNIAAGSISAGQTATLQLIDASTSHNIAMGVDYTNIDHTHFGGYTYDGTVGAPVVSTGAIAAGWHLGEMWYDGVHFYIAFDGETPLQLTTHLLTGSDKLGARITVTPNGISMDARFGFWCIVTGSEA